MASVGGPSTFLLHIAEPPPVLPVHKIDHTSAIDRDDHDIYRGEPSSPPRPSSPSSASLSSSSSSSSSSASGGHLGAITAVVEHAIARWARAWASTSSLGTSTTSSEMSMVTMTKSQMARRRRRRRSSIDAHNARSEREVAALIRAREESRHIPRMFDLYVPYVLDLPPAETATITGPDGLPKHLVHTSSLPLILAHLSATLRGSAKARRAKLPAVHPEVSSSARLLHHDYMMPEQAALSPLSTPLQEAAIRQRGKKGKRRAGAPSTTLVHTPRSSGSETAWWLDVSSPTWEDMSAIGKLLHLHPLTLEDILQQDPREKLEQFPKLGYHFIAFHAIESQKTRELRALGGGRAPPNGLIEEGLVGEVNVYLIIFRDGVCSFHFSDVEEHVDRVRNKVLNLAENINMSSDWIAHGIIDSIVDSVFPVLEGIEKEVADIENYVVSSSEEGPPAVALPVTCDGSPNSSPSEQTQSYEEKTQSPIVLTVKVELSSPTESPGWIPLWVRWVLCHIQDGVKHVRVVFKRSQTHTKTATVRRIARTRRIVTSLSRFLAHKSEVVAQIQKRLLTTGGSAGNEKDNDMFVYMGDVQDHILTLQQSLAHYERVLSQSHPTYLSRLRLSVSKAQSGTDKAIFILTIVSMGVICVQTVIGLNSMNVTLPTNDHAGNHYYLFGIVIAASGLVLLAFGLLLHVWWVRAERKRKQRNYL